MFTRDFLENGEFLKNTIKKKNNLFLKMLKDDDIILTLDNLVKAEGRLVFFKYLNNFIYVLFMHVEIW